MKEYAEGCRQRASCKTKVACRDAPMTRRMYEYTDREMGWGQYAGAMRHNDGKDAKNGMGSLCQELWQSFYGMVDLRQLATACDEYRGDFCVL